MHFTNRVLFCYSNCYHHFSANLLLLPRPIHHLGCVRSSWNCLIHIFSFQYQFFRFQRTAQKFNPKGIAKDQLFCGVWNSQNSPVFLKWLQRSQISHRNENFYRADRMTESGSFSFSFCTISNLKCWTGKKSIIHGEWVILINTISMKVYFLFRVGLFPSLLVFCS